LHQSHRLNEEHVIIVDSLVKSTLQPLAANRMTFKNIEYRADLDGLRALAVVPVIMYHLGNNVFPGGFVGVDVFFVLSGYLITGIVANDLNNNEFSLLKFYDRRLRRIAPALIVVLFFSTLVAVPILFPIDLTRFGSALVATALSISNVHFINLSEYFAPNSEQSPLLHTWSLSVEEQFYLLFPFILSVIWRYAKAWLPIIIWLGFTASLGLSIWGVKAYPTYTFFLLPTRAWELLLGSILALRLVSHPKNTSHREFAAAIGTLSILASMIIYTRETSFPGIAALVPCIGTALIIWSGLGHQSVETWTSRQLGRKVPVFIGVISYSLYLWHWPLIVFTKHLTNGSLTISLQLLLAFAAMVFATMSWHYIEKPFRLEGNFWPSQRHRFVGTGLALLTFVLIGASIKQLDGIPQRMGPIVRELAITSSDFSPLAASCLASQSANKSFIQTCVHGSPVPPKVVVFGDSHGADLSVALGEAAKLRGESVRQVTTSSCSPSVGFFWKNRRECSKHVKTTLVALSETAPSTIILTAAYFDYAPSSNGHMLWRGLSETVRSLQHAGHTVILVGAMPPNHYREPVPLAIARRAYFGSTPGDYRFPLNVKVASEIETNMKRIATAAEAIYIPLVPYFCPDNHNCVGYKNKAVVYFDDSHLTLTTARIIVSEFLEPVVWPKHRNPG
jgi:peptidoglycan/LPS O-acetylase OafA/YrhL